VSSAGGAGSAAPADTVAATNPQINQAARIEPPSIGSTTPGRVWKLQ
jgi:hypothetical protein